MTSFDQFWSEYDKKVGKDKVQAKWYKLPAEDHVKIMAHLPGFVSRQRNKQYRPNPLTYLNGKMWLDEAVGETEEKVLYKPSPGFKSNSEDYRPKEFKRSEFIKKARRVLKHNFETGAYVEDHGGVYTNLLTEHCGMKVDVKVEKLIANEVGEEAATPRKNRFEEEVKINIPSEVRDRCLNWWLNEQRNNKRELWKEI